MMNSEREALSPPHGYFADDIAREGRIALAALDQSAALIAVSLGPPVKWRLNQLNTAVNLYDDGQYRLAMDFAHLATIAIERIPAVEQDAGAPVVLGAVRERIRRLRTVR